MWIDVANDCSSSYKSNKLGWVLYGLTRSLCPILSVEFGILHGYSTLFIGAALRDSKGGHLLAYDRWPGHLPGIEQEVRQNVTKAGLDNWVTVETRDVLARPPDLRNIDLLHVDLDNTAERVQWAMGEYAPRLSEAGVIVFEGGIKERDELEWVARHGKPIRSILPIKGWEHFSVPRFPGMLVMRRIDER